MTIKAKGTLMYNLYRMLSPEVLTPVDMAGSSINSLDQLKDIEELYSKLHALLEPLQKALDDYNLSLNTLRSSNGNVDQKKASKLYDDSTLKELEEKEWELELSNEENLFMRELISEFGWKKVKSRAVMIELLSL